MFSGTESAAELGWLSVEPSCFFGSSSGRGFLTLALLPGSSSTWTGLGALVMPMGVVWPFFSTAWLNFPGSSPPGSESSNRTPLLTSSSRGFRIDIFRSKTSDVSLNLSLLFFFRHFQGLKILPKPENLLFLLVGGVTSPASTPSMTMTGSAVAWPAPSVAWRGTEGQEQPIYDFSIISEISLSLSSCGSWKGSEQ